MPTLEATYYLANERENAQRVVLTQRHVQGEGFPSFDVLCISIAGGVLALHLPEGRAPALREAFMVALMPAPEAR